MEPGNIRFGGGSAGSVLHPLVAILLCLAIGLVFVLPWRRVVGPLLLTAILVPLGQVVVVAGIHFTVLRIITLFGLARLLRSKRSIGSLAGGFNSVDKAFLLWAVFYALDFVLLYMETQALIQRLGFLVDVLGMYFLLRYLIRDEEDVYRVVKLLTAITAIVALGMIGEQLTRQNVFGLLGGVASAPEVRDGRIRSQGAFQVSIMAGTFGATLLPLLVGFWKVYRLKITVIVGMVSTGIIVYTSASSTPLLAYVAGILALFLWPARKLMRPIRWGIAITLIALHLVMKAPVWALIARADVTGSSSGAHRYELVDNFIRHFSDWWLLGAKDYDKWGWDMWDLSNQFVAYGITGGLICLIFFVAIISRSFGRIGTARRVAQGSHKQEWLLWCLGVTMFTHVVAYFGIGYWDQMQVAWFAFLAIVSAVSSATMRSPLPPTEVVDSIWAGELPLLSPVVDSPVNHPLRS